MSEPRGRCVAPGDGVPDPAAGGEVLLGAAESAGRLSVLVSEAPAGDRVPPHIHHETDECFYVLAGDYEVTCGEDRFDAGPGCLVYLPRSLPHAYRVGAPPARKLILAVPAGLESFFADLGAGADPDELAHRHRATFL